MKKRDLIRVIEAVEAIIRIEEITIQLTGVGLEEGECNKVYALWDILRDHAKPQFQVDDDDDADAVNYHSFAGILSNPKLTAEQKYEYLMQEDIKYDIW